MPGHIVRAGILFILAVVAAPAWAVDLSKAVDFDVAPQTLSSAILEFSQQAKVQIVTGANLGDRRTEGVRGHLAIGEALSRLLQASGLSYRVVGETSITIGPDTPQSGIEPSPPAGSNAQTTNAAAGQTQALGPVEVTGSRLARTAQEGAQQVKVYTKQQIDESGQTSVGDFLNTLPDVSVNSNETGLQALGAGTGVQLHGLPFGTTLVLINGRRLEPSADQNDAGFSFFDLSNIPLGIVERIEVVSEGSSAVYGSDAIAGVVNVILRKDFDGLEANLKYGGAAGLYESDADLAWGRQWERGAISLVANVQNRGGLVGAERDASANGEILPLCPQANIFSTNGGNLPGTNAPYAAVSPNSTVSNYIAAAGSLNQCPLAAYNPIIPPMHREGLFFQGNYNLTPWLQVFAELIYSHVEKNSLLGPPSGVFGEPGYQTYTVSATNPFNPYGQTVGVSELLTGVAPMGDEDAVTFIRPLVGARGEFLEKWHWEISGWASADRTHSAQTQELNPTLTQAAFNSTDPATALNPFVGGPAGSPQLLQSLMSTWADEFYGQSRMVNGYIRGPFLVLPSGPLDVVVGSEYERSTQYSNNINNSDPGNYPGQSTTHRDSYAVFGEAHLPILANHKDPKAGDVLALTIAGRYENYDDFGSKTVPQYGFEWRPSSTLLVRGTYAKAFQAPSLPELYEPQVSQVYIVSDPLLGGQTEVATLVSGGNPALSPETGQSKTLGLVYSSKDIPGLQMSLTNWAVDEGNNIQRLIPDVFIDNEADFPGRVVRAASCSSGPPCPITTVNVTSINFGEINISGLDYQLNYRYRSDIGVFTPSISATETYHYSAALVPGAAPVDATSKAQDSGTWAPRWKGTLAMGWKLGVYSASVDGRYVGRYQDYDSTTQLGNFWLCDASFRWAVGRAYADDNQYLKGTYLSLGGVNIFDSRPQHSNYDSGVIGYDPSQADLRGRYLYAQMGVKW